MWVVRLSISCVCVCENNNERKINDSIVIHVLVALTMERKSNKLIGGHLRIENAVHVHEYYWPNSINRLSREIHFHHVVPTHVCRSKI